MTSEQVEDVLQKRGFSVYQIRFKTRNSIKGLFIETADYHELSRKNLWRIVSESYIDQYRKSADLNLARIFNGSEFTRLETEGKS